MGIISILEREVRGRSTAKQLYGRGAADGRYCNLFENDTSRRLPGQALKVNQCGCGLWVNSVAFFIHRVSAFYAPSRKKYTVK